MHVGAIKKSDYLQEHDQEIQRKYGQNPTTVYAPRQRQNMHHQKQQQTSRK